MDSENSENKDYWIASSYALATNTDAQFGLYCVFKGGVYINTLWDASQGATIVDEDWGWSYSDTDCTVDSNVHGIRAVVSLNYEVKLTPTANGSEWNITE